MTYAIKTPKRIADRMIFFWSSPGQTLDEVALDQHGIEDYTKTGPYYYIVYGAQEEMDVRKVLVQFNLEYPNCEIVENVYRQPDNIPDPTRFLFKYAILFREKG